MIKIFLRGLLFASVSIVTAVAISWLLIDKFPPLENATAVDQKESLVIKKQELEVSNFKGIGFEDPSVKQDFQAKKPQEKDEVKTLSKLYLGNKENPDGTVSPASPEERADAFVKVHVQHFKKSKETVAKYFVKTLKPGQKSVELKEIQHRPFTPADKALSMQSVEVLILNRLGYEVKI